VLQRVKMYVSHIPGGAKSMIPNARRSVGSDLADATPECRDVNCDRAAELNSPRRSTRCSPLARNEGLRIVMESPRGLLIPRCDVSFRYVTRFIRSGSVNKLRAIY